MRTISAAVVAMFTIVSVSMANPASAAELPPDEAICGKAVFWGIQRGASPDIYQINLEGDARTATLVTSTEKNLDQVDYPNGLAYDDRRTQDSSRLYYAERTGSTSELFYFNTVDQVHVPAGSLSGVVAGAAIHDGAYYYIPQGTDELWVAPLSPDGFIDAPVRDAADGHRLVKDGVSGGNKAYGFGDLVVSPDGMIYVSAGTRTSAELFRVDLSGGNYFQFPVETSLLQLALGQEGQIYAHHAGTGMFSTVNATSGELTEIGTVSGSETGTFTDLGSFNAAQNCPPPPCVTIDFEGLEAGTIIDGAGLDGANLTSSDPVNHPAMIFDSSNPTGGDFDLGSPHNSFGGPGAGVGGAPGAPGENNRAHGKILIVSEDTSTIAPDDNEEGGSLTFQFTPPRPIRTVGILDIDDDESGSIIATFTDGNQATVELANLGNNSFQEIQLDYSGVATLEIVFTGSGALAEITCTPSFAPCAAPTSVWGIQRGGNPSLNLIDLGATKSATAVAETGLNSEFTDYPNGLAFESISQRMFYAVREGNASALHSFRDDEAHRRVGQLSGIVAGATIYGGVYYYIPQGTGDLYAAELGLDGSIISNSLVKADVSASGRGYGFGDLAVTDNGELMYVSAGNRDRVEFFTITLDGNNYSLITDEHPLLQLAFGSGGTLFAHNAGTGAFYSINRATGILANLGTVSGSETNRFTDLASVRCPTGAG